MLEDPYKKKVEELEDVYRQAVNSYQLEDFYGHFHAWLGVYKDLLKRNAPYGASAEKIAELEQAVREFKQTYDAEKAEAEKMPISWHEAIRVQKMFDEVQDSFENPTPARREN